MLHFRRSPTLLLSIVIAALLGTLVAIPAQVASASDNDEASNVTAPVPVDTQLSGGLSATGRPQLLEHLPASSTSGPSQYTQIDDVLEGLPDSQTCPVSAFVDVRDPSTLSAINGSLLGRAAGSSSQPGNLWLCDAAGNVTASPLAALVSKIAAIPHAIAVINIMGRSTGAGPVKVPDLGTALAPLGFTQAVAGLDFGSWTLSGIGMSGLPVGQAWQVGAPTSTAANGTPAGADIRGYFIRNADNRWQFAPMRWASYNTHNGGGWNSNLISVYAPGNTQLGGTTGGAYPATLPASYPGIPGTPVGGFQLVTLSRSTLALISNRVFVTRMVNGPTPALGAFDLPSLAAALRSAAADPSQLVFLASVGAPFNNALALTISASDPATVAREGLAEAVQAAGGSPQAIEDLGTWSSNTRWSPSAAPATAIRSRLNPARRSHRTAMPARWPARSPRRTSVNSGARTLRARAQAVPTTSPSSPSRRPHGRIRQTPPSSRRSLTSPPR